MNFYTMFEYLVTIHRSQTMLDLNVYLYESPLATLALPFYAESFFEEFVHGPSPILTNTTCQRLGQIMLRFINFAANHYNHYFSVISPYDPNREQVCVYFPMSFLP